MWQRSIREHLNFACFQIAYKLSPIRINQNKKVLLSWKYPECLRQEEGGCNYNVLNESCQLLAFSWLLQDMQGALMLLLLSWCLDHGWFMVCMDPPATILSVDDMPVFLLPPRTHAMMLLLQHVGVHSPPQLPLLWLVHIHISGSTCNSTDISGIAPTYMSLAHSLCCVCDLQANVPVWWIP